jgi:2-amino-4-hydroxy-6-hydroxymethyldihydropteridine diphosphokinase
MARKTTRCFLGLGSSLGNRAAYLRFALESIGSIEETELVAKSGIYETEPVGGVAKNMFFNAVAAIDTNLDCDALLKEIRRIELEAGRRRVQRNEDRTLDIDILFFGNEVITRRNLEIPHPRLRERRFALAPLCEIAPDFIDPVTGHRVIELLGYCVDPGAVIRRGEL